MGLCGNLASDSSDLYLFPGHSETWLTPNDTTALAELSVPNYKLHHCPRSNLRGGGSALFFRHCLDVRRVNSSEESFIPSIRSKFHLFSSRYIKVSGFGHYFSWILFFSRKFKFAHIFFWLRQQVSQMILAITT